MEKLVHPNDLPSRPSGVGSVGREDPEGWPLAVSGHLREHEGNSWKDSKQLARLGVETQVLKEAYFWLKKGPGGGLEHGCLMCRGSRDPWEFIRLGPRTGHLGWGTGSEVTQHED